MLDYLFFDLYGTLIDIETDEPSPRTRARFELWVARRYGHGAAARERAMPLFDAIRSVRPPDRPHGEPDLEPVIEEHLREVLLRPVGSAEVAAAAAAFREASRLRLGVFPGVIAALETLSRRAPIGLISNAQWLFTRPELERLGLMHLFDPLIISSQVGVRKPGPEIFELALQRTRVRPERALYVGNDPSDDIVGASRLGFHTCLVGPAASRPGLPAEPDLRAASVADLPELLAPGFGLTTPARG